jgi:hypothetical protein
MKNIFILLASADTYSLVARYRTPKIEKFLCYHKICILFYPVRCTRLTSHPNNFQGSFGLR